MPNEKLYSFSGKLTIEANGKEEHLGISVQNILLKGAYLKNTSEIAGFVVYTGVNCKISK